ncbi:MAG: hypothetical protein V2I43_12885 [Parvularcula sp.]|nr:hypothetical protein [Parvularcula sp.]
MDDQITLSDALVAMLLEGVGEAFGRRLARSVTTPSRKQVTISSSGRTGRSTFLKSHLPR